LNLDELFRFTSVRQATSLQKKLAADISASDDFRTRTRLLCGMDVAYRGNTAFVAACIWDTKSRTFVGTKSAIEDVSVKYLPGLLGFREGALLARISEQIRPRPDIFLVDGQGLAHPRRFGLACHVGLAVGRPTIGVAKSSLYGRVEGDRIVDPDGIQIGNILKAPSGRKFFVSVGHKISLETATRLVEDCLVDGHPAPLRQAHLESVRLKGSQNA
jgi:deoxyribonuclease V